jgi:metal-sulfur cluster biosynthetic enzyme
MKSILKQVYGVELASQKVELGLIDSITSSMKEANKGAMKAIDLANSAKKPASDSLKLNENLLKSIDNVIKKAKEIGIDEVVSDLNKKRDQVVVNIKTINDVLNALNKI